MKRRDFLATFGAFAINPLSFKGDKHFGWLPGYSSSKPNLHQVSDLYSYGSHKISLLYQAYEAVTKNPWLAHAQKGPDCVAQASGGGMDILTTVRIALLKKREKWVTKSSTDAIYSGGRNLIAASKMRSGGMHGAWAVEYLKQYGNLLRLEYPPFDLSPYSASTLNYWDKNGLPPSLLKTAEEHPLLDYAPVYSWEEVRDSVAAHYPILFCASLGANNSKRDKDGFIKPSGTWYHAWLIAGIKDDNRPGACLLNSHSPFWGSGPKTHGQPDGSVWVDAKHIDKHCRNFRDSYALSNYKGFPKPEEDYIIW